MEERRREKKNRVENRNGLRGASAHHSDGGGKEEKLRGRARTKKGACGRLPEHVPKDNQCTSVAKETC
tara:strand:+ start:673 stop:876 length:204 start_codon:yes stop_codon:yes gene_type:complete